MLPPGTPLGQRDQPRPAHQRPARRPATVLRGDLRGRRALGGRCRRRRRAHRTPLAPRPRPRDRRLRRVVPRAPHRRARRRQRQRPREPQRRHPHRRRLTVVPGGTGRGGRRGHRRRVAVPHPPVAPASDGCSSCSWRSARSTWASRFPTPRSRRWCSAGASAPRCTSCSAHPVDARRARRSVPRSRSSASPRTMSSSRAANPGARP